METNWFSQAGCPAENKDGFYLNDEMSPDWDDLDQTQVRNELDISFIFSPQKISQKYQQTDFLPVPSIMQNIEPLLALRRSKRKSCLTINQLNLASGSFLPLLDQRVRQGGECQPGGGEEQGILLFQNISISL